MELGLSLGESSSSSVFKTSKSNKSLDICMGFGSFGSGGGEDRNKNGTRISSDPPVQLDLLPLTSGSRYPHHHLGFPWSCENGSSEGGSSSQTRGFDVNRLPSTEEETEEGATVSSPNSIVSAFQIDFNIYRGPNRRDADSFTNEADIERTPSRASDEEENGLNRKKLRLSKEQSAFLEESFKEHNTLNPKQKLALAKQLNLRPRQVEVWFQNRRARTKLKQTEVDCEYLKRCCETLTEENRRLQKELQDLRTLKSAQPYYMQLPATTLTMCPSCERVGSSSVTPATGAMTKSGSFSAMNKPLFFPLTQTHQTTTS